MEEAIRLVECTKASLKEDARDGGSGAGSAQDAASRVFGIIRDYAKRTMSTSIKYSEVR